MIIASVIIALALVAGLIANRVVRSRDNQPSVDEPSVKDMISPLETLAVLILAFVLVGAAASFDAAEDSAAAEAGTLDHLYETAGYTQEPIREQLQAATVCYSRAVTSQEWPAMEDESHSPTPSIWTSEFRESFQRLAKNDEGAIFANLVETDRDRAEARQQRLTESSPAIPGIMYWFMALTLAVTIAGFAYSIPLRGGGFHLLAVGLLAALFISSLLLIRDVDAPYTGVVRVDSDQMAITQEDITEDFGQDYGLDRLPCDERGDRNES